MDAMIEQFHDLRALVTALDSAGVIVERLRAGAWFASDPKRPLGDSPPDAQRRRREPA
jgi:hypothetical protein